MVNVTYVQPDGSSRHVDVAEGTSAMEGAIRNDIAGIVAEYKTASHRPVEELREVSASRMRWRELMPWVTVVILLLLYLLAFLDRQILSLLVDPIRRDLGIDDLQISLLMGLSFGLLYTAAGLLMGSLVDRWSRRWILYWGVTAWALATAAGGLAQGFTMLFVTRMVVGLGEAVLGPAAYSMISDAVPRQHLSKAIGIFSAGSSIGAGASFVLGGTLIAYVAQGNVPHISLLGFLSDLDPWRVALILIGLLGVPVALLIFAIPEPARQLRPGLAAATWSDALKLMLARKRLWLSLAGGNACVAVLAYSTTSWMPSYLARTFGWSPAEIGISVGVLLAVAGTAGQLASGWLVDRCFSRGMKDAHFRIYAAAVFISVIAAIVGLLSSDAHVLLSMVAVPFLLLFANGAYGATAIQHVTPSALRGRTSAAFLVLVNIPGLLLGPTIVAFIHEHWMTQSLGGAMAVTYAIFGPLVFIATLSGMRPMRQALDAMERGA